MTTEATCKADGVRTYTAKVTFEGKEYTDTKTEVIPATPDTPATGDSSNMTALWVVLAVAGLGIIALVVLLVTKRSKKQNG